MDDIRDAYTPKCNKYFRFRDQDGKDFPHWMESVCLGGFREQGWAAYAQPDGTRIGTGKWGDRLLFLANGTITTDEAIRSRSNQVVALDPAAKAS